MTQLSVFLRRLCPPMILRVLSACAFAVLFGTGPTSAQQEVDRSEIEEIVREYLLENPEVIAEALAELDRREKEAAEMARLQALTDNADIIFDSTRQVVLGNPEGSITLVEFFDYNCGFCKRAHGDMVKLIDEYPNLRVVLKEFPVLGEGSLQAAQVAVALNSVAPEKYGEFHDTLMIQRGQANHASAIAAATGVGIPEAELLKVMATNKADETIEEVSALASQLGLTGTPSYVIGNEVVIGAVGYDQLRTRLDAMKECGKTAC